MKTKDKYPPAPRGFSSLELSKEINRRGSLCHFRESQIPHRQAVASIAVQSYGSVLSLTLKVAASLGTCKRKQVTNATTGGGRGGVSSLVDM